MMRRQNATRGLRRWFWAIVLMVALSLLAPGLPAAVAQDLPKASVVVDGDRLFQISSSGDYSASERVETINQQLREAVQAKQPPSVEVAGTANLPIIRLNNNHLLTVTDQDVLPGRSPQDQATVWADKIRRTIEQAQQERTSGYLRQAGLLAGGVLAVAILLHWGLGRFWRQRLRPELRAVTHIPDPDQPTTDQPAPIDLLLTLLLVLIRTAVWLSATLYVANLFPWTRQWSYQITSSLLSSFFSPIFTLGNSKYSVTNLLILAVLLFVLAIVTKSVTNLLKSRLLGVTVANRGAREAIAILIRYSLFFVGALVLLQVWGIDISSLAILVSALGVGIGLGLQDIAKDVGSGLVIVFERPIQVGDFVQVGNFQGTIERIGTRSTLVRTLDHISIIVPNSRFLSGEVINWSHGNPVSRLHLPVGVAYGTDLELVRKALLDAAADNLRVLSSPKPQVFFKGFGDSSLDFELLIWTAEPSKQLPLKSELYFSIARQFQHHGIEVPFPQRDLNVRSDGLPLELSPAVMQTIQEMLQRSAQRGQSNGERLEP